MNLAIRKVLAQIVVGVVVKGERIMQKTLIIGFLLGIGVGKGFPCGDCYQKPVITEGMRTTIYEPLAKDRRDKVGRDEVGVDDLMNFCVLSYVGYLINNDEWLYLKQGECFKTIVCSNEGQKQGITEANLKGFLLTIEDDVFAFKLKCLNDENLQASESDFFENCRQKAGQFVKNPADNSGAKKPTQKTHCNIQ